MLREKLKSDGYVVIEQLFTEQQMASIAESLRAALLHGRADLAKLSLDDLILEREKEDHQHVYDAMVSVGSSAAAYELLGTSKLLDSLSKAFSVTLESLHLLPLHIQIQNPGDGRFDYRWHQESSFYPWCKDVLNGWFPIHRPSARETGTMFIIPKSHTAGWRKADAQKDENGFWQIECPVTESERSAGFPMELNPGDIVLFDANLVHCSLGNSGTTPRITGILRGVNMSTQPKLRPLYKAPSYQL